jgi:hypothetical protein
MVNYGMIGAMILPNVGGWLGTIFTSKKTNRIWSEVSIALSIIIYHYFKLDFSLTPKYPVSASVFLTPKYPVSASVFLTPKIVVSCRCRCRFSDTGTDTKTVLFCVLKEKMQIK